MSKEARVIIEVEENFDKTVDDDLFDDQYPVDDLGEFAEFVWEKRLEELGLDGGLLNIDCYKID